MNWAINNIRRLKVGLIGVSVILAVANLALGPEPQETRLVSVVAIALAVPFLFFGMRWLLTFQIGQHGLQSWIVQFGTFAFYLFGIGAVFSLVLIAANIGKHTPFAVMFVAPAVIAYSAVDTVRRFRGEGATIERAG